MTNDITIYSNIGCPFAQRSRIVLNEKKIAHQIIEIDLANKPKDFLEISPTGKVPLVRHNGEVIYESSIINEYLNDVFTEPKLLADDALMKAQMRIWIHYCNSQYVPNHYRLLTSQDEQTQAQAKQTLLDKLDYLEQELMAKQANEQPFMFGGEISLVDISFYPFFERMVSLEYYRGFIMPKHCQRLKAWFERMQQRETIVPTSHDEAYYIKRYESFARGEVNM